MSGHAIWTKLGKQEPEGEEMGTFPSLARDAMCLYGYKQWLPTAYWLKRLQQTNTMNFGDWLLVPKSAI